MTGWRTLTLVAALLLGGCASITRVDNDVQSFASWTSAVPRPLSFRFERLPSQQIDTVTQDAVEQQALASLAQAGLVLDTAKAGYSLQLTTQMLAESTWDRGYGPYGAYGAWGRHGPWIGGGRACAAPSWPP